MKKILIVSPFFAPENSVASIRFTKIAKYLKRIGYDVTVIASQVSAKLVEDPILKKDMGEIGNIIRIRYPELLYYPVQKRFGAEAHRTSGNGKKNKNNRLMASLSWGYSSFCNVILGRKFIRYIKDKKQNYDVVITTYGPLAAHILGNFMKKHSLCTTWIEDFRDPLTALWSQSFTTALTHFYGVMLMKRADFITAVSKGEARKLAREAGTFGVKIQDKLRIISNGYDPEDGEGLMGMEAEKDKLVFSYCGSIYEIDGEAKNDLSLFFKALSDLINQHQVDRDTIKVQYAGGSWPILQKTAEKYGVEDILYNHGKITREESLEVQRRSDIVIAAVWNNKEETGVISGKFFETLLVQRNVLAVVAGEQAGSELAKMIEELQCGFAYEEASEDEQGLEHMKQWILSRYHEKLTKGSLSYFASTKAGKYSHSYLARKFEKLF